MTYGNFLFLLHLDDIDAPRDMLFEEANDCYFAHFEEFMSGLSSPATAGLYFPTRPAIYLDQEHDTRSGHDLLSEQEAASQTFAAYIRKSWAFVGEATARFAKFSPSKLPFTPDLSQPNESVYNAFLAYVDGLMSNLANKDVIDEDFRDWVGQKYERLMRCAQSARHGAFSREPGILLAEWPCFDLSGSREPNALYVARLHF